MLVDRSLPATIEEVVEEVIQSVADTLEMVLEDFMPDGVPFNKEPKTEAEQLQEYLESGLHDNPDAAANWIRTGVAQVTQKLQEWGVPPELITSIHPYNIVQVEGYKYSARMERLLRERMQDSVATPISTEPLGE